MGLRRFLGLKKDKPVKRNARSLRLAKGRFASTGIRATEALERFIEIQDVHTVLDIGSGAGIHARHMRDAGKQVTCLSLIEPADVLADYKDYTPQQPFDGIWASHVLEHQPNVNFFLRKCFQDLRINGVLAISVPPLKYPLVGGHLTLWTPASILYNLIIAGFDCSNARVGSYSYDLSVIVRKVPATLPDNLHYDEGDIEKIAHFFPTTVYQGVDGRLEDIRW